MDPLKKRTKMVFVINEYYSQIQCFFFCGENLYHCYQEKCFFFFFPHICLGFLKKKAKKKGENLDSFGKVVVNKCVYFPFWSIV